MSWNKKPVPLRNAKARAVTINLACGGEMDSFHSQAGVGAACQTQPAGMLKTPHPFG